MSAAGAQDYRRLMAKALGEIQRLKADLTHLRQGQGEPIALIGASCRLPGAPDLQAFWDLLEGGVDAIGDIPPDRWDVEAHYDPDPGRLGKIYARQGGFLDQVDQFDPLFFGVSPREAETMDPQHRLLMEVSWEALEHAGIAADRLRGSRTGVYVGMMSQDYSRLNSDPGQIDAHTGTNGLNSIGAARLAYGYDLAGPAICVDTACSSSLVAAHLACRALRARDCDLALVGGVNVILSPYMMSLVCGAGVLAPDGRCKTFDAAANGFARGEGCVVLVMKRLSDAQADGDEILAVIRGSAINQDGRSAGITVPSQLAQESVIREALKDGGVAPAEVGYIEAHGTGTPLGDPIEIGALGEVFGPGRGSETPLVIGSVKTNFGHLEAASGLTGLLKAALSVKRGTIPRQLHFRTPNPHANWGAWPIQVADRNLAWPAGPRIAGVSSFGIAGTNAHLVVQGPPAAPPRPPVEPGPHLLTVSAKSAKALARRLEDLAAVLRTPGAPALADVALTLATGRQHFAHRCAIVADSCDAATTLAAWPADGDGAPDLARGVVRREASADPQALHAAIDQLAAGSEARRHALQTLGRLYVAGATPDWPELYDRARARLANLPTYPFTRERFWLSEAGSRPTGEAEHLHTLVHANVSDLSGLRFASRLDPHLPIFSDHRVAGRPILPGVAYLEMARAAVAQVTGRPTPQLRNVAWLRPLTGEGPVQVSIALRPAGEDRVTFEILSGEDVLHCQGLAVLEDAGLDGFHDLDALRATLDGEELDGEDCYLRFATLGLDYGPQFRTLRRVWTGPGQALAQLEVADPQELAPYGLHPGLMDGALQASLALRLTADGEPGLSLPFALGTLEARHACAAAMWAVVVHHDAETPGAPAMVDIDLCDADGRVCVRLRDASTRPLAVPAKGSPQAEGLNVTTAIWEPAKPARAAARTSGRTLILGGSPAQRAAVAALFPDAEELDTAEPEAGQLGERPVAHLIWFATAGANLADEEQILAAQEQGALRAFRLTKTLLALGHGARDLTWTVLTEQAQAADPGDVVAPDQAAIHGFFGALAKEYPNWAVRLVDLAGGGATPWAEVFDVAPDPEGAPWLLRGGQWRRRALAKVRAPGRPASSPPAGGVHLVLGGAGGIGAVWSEHLIRTRGARMIWLGRRPLDATLQAEIERLARLGPAPDYIQADATDRAALEAARLAIHDRHGPVTSVTHSALVLADASLARMDEARFRAAFDAKAATSVRLAQVFGRDPLEFFLMFSSLRSFVSAAGQSNYAAGCVFEDAFAQWLRPRVDYPVKVMNWGYWGGVGAVATQDHRARAAQAGIGSIEPAEGMEVLTQLLDGRLHQLGAEKIAAGPPAPGASLVQVLPPDAPSLMAGLAERFAAWAPALEPTA